MGVIFEIITNPRQAKITKNASAYWIPIGLDQKGIGRMKDPSLIKDIKHNVLIPMTFPVEHFVEAQIL